MKKLKIAPSKSWHGGIRKPRPKALAFSIAALLAWTGVAATVPSANADFTFQISQVGANVVVTGSGTLNTTGLTFLGSGIGPAAGINSAHGFIGGNEGNNDVYAGITGPSNFGSGFSTSASASTSSGDAVLVQGDGSGLYLPQGYVSGAALSDSTTYVNTTISNLGITPGTYVYTLPSGDTLTVTAALPATSWLGGASGAWTGNNWASDSSGTPTTATPTSGDAITFSASGAANQNTTLGANFTILSLTINDPAPVTINSGAGGPYTLTISGAAGTGITVNSGAGLVTIGANVTFSGASDTIAVNNTAGLVINGVVGGIGLDKEGAGTLILNGANNYSNGTTLGAGTIGIGNSSALSTGAVTVAAGGGSIYAAGASQTVSNAFTLNGGLTVVNDPNGAQTLTLNGLLSGSGDLTMNGTGTLALGAANTYGGSTTISSGTIQLGIANALPTGTDVTLGTANSAVAGALDLHGNSQTVDGISVAGGNTGGAANIITSSSGAATLTVSSTVTNSAFGGVISGPLSLIKAGAGTTLILTGANTYSGTTTISAGVLQIGNGGATGQLGSGNVVDNGTLTFNLSSSPTVNNAISGAGILNQNGAGKTTLTGANTYTGATNVNAGVLEIDGSTASANTSVNPGATLQGTGIVGGNVNNHGVVHAGDSPGTLTVKGNYTQTGNGGLRIDLASPTNFSRLQVGGQASLAGTVTANFIGGFTPTRGETFTILTAGAGVSGKFASLQAVNFTNNPFSSLIVEYFPTEVVLEATQLEFATLPGLTPNERALAVALDRLPSNPGSIKLLTYLERLSPAQLPGAFDRMAAAEYGAIYQIAVSGSATLATNVQNRLDQIHAGATAGAPGPMGPPDDKGSKEIMPPPEFRSSVWANGSGEFVNVGDTSNARGYNFGSGGVTAGVDYKFTDHFLLGALFNYTRTDSDLTGAGGLDADTFRGGAYASFFGSGAYVNAFLGGGGNSYDFSRQGLNSFVRGATSGGEFHALTQTGYDAHAGAFTYGPVASFQYTYTGLGAFNETGSLAPLHVDSGSGNSLRTNVGLRAAYEWHIGGMTLTPQVRATWQHEYGDVSNEIDSEMLLGGPAFRITSAVIGRDSLLLNAGFTLQINPQVATYAYYDGELARTNYQANNVMAGVRVSF